MIEPDNVSLSAIAALLSRNDPDILGQFAQTTNPPRAFLNEFDDAIENQRLQGCEYATESYMLSWTALMRALIEAGYVARFDGTEDATDIMDRLTPLIADAGALPPETALDGDDGPDTCGLLSAVNADLARQDYALALIDTDRPDRILTAVVTSDDLEELTGLASEIDQRIHTDYARLPDRLS